MLSSQIYSFSLSCLFNADSVLLTAAIGRLCRVARRARLFNLRARISDCYIFMFMFQLGFVEDAKDAENILKDMNIREELK